MAADQSRPRMLPDGSFVGRDGTEYRRTDVRLKRKLCDSLVSQGAVLVTSVYPEGVRWYEGRGVAEQWQQIRARLVEGKNPPVRDLQWVGHLWESEAGLSLLYFEG